MLDRFLSVLVAVSLAFLVWLYVRSRDQEMLDNVPVPVQITLASGLEEHYELEINGPSQVPVSFTGPRSRMRHRGGRRCRVSSPPRTVIYSSRCRPMDDAISCGL